MPEAYESGMDVYTVSFDETEMALLDKHAKMWGLSKDQAVIDLFDYSLAAIPGEKGPEAVDELFADDDGVKCVGVTVVWPMDGPWKDANADDKRFVTFMVDNALREALLIVGYKKKGEVD